MDRKKLTLVLGGWGVVGKQLCKQLSDHDYNFVSPIKENVSLSNFAEIEDYLDCYRPSYIINLAAVKTTVMLNKNFPFDIYNNTVLMNTNLYKALVSYKPEKVISIVSSCAYWGDYVGPDNDCSLKENGFDFGRVHDSVEPHGYAKRNLYYLNKFIRQQYNVNSTCIALNTIYGGTDWSKPDNLKVLESIVKKIIDARENNDLNITLWGNGEPRREFIHRNDAVEGILRTVDVDVPFINIGCGYDIKIRDLAEGIKLATQYKGDILWDDSMPTGQIRKLLDNSLCKQLLKWTPEISLVSGIDQLIQSYEKYNGMLRDE